MGNLSSIRISWLTPSLGCVFAFLAAAIVGVYPGESSGATKAGCLTLVEARKSAIERILTQSGGLGGAVIFLGELCPDDGRQAIRIAMSPHPDPFVRAANVRLLGFVNGHDAERAAALTRSYQAPFINERDIGERRHSDRLRRLGVDPDSVYGPEGETPAYWNTTLVKAIAAVGTTLPERDRVSLFAIMQTELEQFIYIGIEPFKHAMVPFLASLPNRNKIALEVIRWSSDGPPVYRRAAISLAATIPDPSDELRHNVIKRCNGDWRPLHCAVLLAKWGDQSAFEALKEGLAAVTGTAFGEAYALHAIPGLLLSELGDKGIEALRHEVQFGSPETAGRAAKALCALGPEAGADAFARVKQLHREKVGDRSIQIAFHRCSAERPIRWGVLALHRAMSGD